MSRTVGSQRLQAATETDGAMAPVLGEADLESVKVDRARVDLSGHGRVEDERSGASTVARSDEPERDQRASYALGPSDSSGPTTVSGRQRAQVNFDVRSAGRRRLAAIGDIGELDLVVIASTRPGGGKTRSPAALRRLRVNEPGAVRQKMANRHIGREPTAGDSPERRRRGQQRPRPESCTPPSPRTASRYTTTGSSW